MKFSDNLKKIRKDNNLSQEELAEKLGVSRQSVSKWESSQAYPEMDKMITLCKMFNINMDELLNQDISEINNEKQSKMNVNKYIDDFLSYITKTINMFSSMKLKEQVKCLMEQIVIGIILFVVLLFLGIFLDSILWDLLHVLPDETYYLIRSILRGIYLLGSLIIFVSLILYIFKVRYLDYYVFIKEDNIDEENLEPEIKEVNKDIKVKELREEKIIIRDPKHSGYKFINGLLKCVLFIIKSIMISIAVLIEAFLCVSFVFFIASLIMIFLIKNTGLVFVGGLILLIGLVLLNYIFINILYNFIISSKMNKRILSILFIISLVLIGIGAGLGLIGFASFEYKDEILEVDYTSTEEIIKMDKDLVLFNYYGGIEYRESKDKDVRVIIEKSNLFEAYIEERVDNEIYFNHYLTEDVFYTIRTILKDINNKQIVEYSDINIIVYTTKDNIKILKDNYDNYFSYED